MTQREHDRLVALKKADKKLITPKQAAQQTGLGKRELAWKRCQTRPRAASAPAEPEPAAAPAGEASRQAPRRRGSGWMEGFDLKKSPSAWQAARASGARPAGAPDSAWGAPSNQDSMGSAGPTAPGGRRVV